MMEMFLKLSRNMKKVEDIHDKYYYILHLSDLHFGKKNINERERFAYSYL